MVDMSNSETIILTSDNVDKLDNKHLPKDVEMANLTKTTDDFQSQTLHRTTVTEDQKKLVKKTHAENIYKQEKMDKDSITPIGNHCIIKVKIRNSIIQTPGSQVSNGMVEWIQLWKVSERLKTTMPELKENKYCNINLQLVLRVGGTPCYEETNYLYFKVSAEQIEYLYDLV